MSLINFIGTSSAAYYLTTQGKEFTAAATPVVSKYAGIASSKLAQFSNWIGVGATFSKYAPGIGAKIVKFTPDFKALTNLSPVHGLVAGQAVSIMAGLVEGVLKGTCMPRFAPVRIVASHIIAGAAVFGLSLLAFKVGMAAAALTIGGAVTLTTTALAITLVLRTVSGLWNCCCTPAAAGEEDDDSNPPSPRRPITGRQ